MNRRQFIVGSVAAGLAPLRVVSAQAARPVDDVHRQAPPCGLFCPSCDEVALGQCHGCGCGCGRCHGEGSAQNCRIFECAAQRKVEHCGICPEFPCAESIGFCYDPIWVSHRSTIEQLKRRTRIGTVKWIEEQSAYWTAERKKAFHFLLAECKERSERSRG